jgi:MoaA/NifB/PqqE/SkfB family radical SAM enzyme
MHATLHLLTHTDFPALTRHAVETLQLNLGYRCNQSCLHCHVNAGPQRTEEMTARRVPASPPSI